MELKNAAAAVRELGIEEAISEKLDLLYSRLTEEEADAIRVSGGRNLPVLASLLTTVNVFINYASTRRRLQSAFGWLRREWGVESHHEQVSLLGTMTLLYIADEGLRRTGDDDRKAEDWTRLRQYVCDVEAEVLAAAD